VIRDCEDLPEFSVRTSESVVLGRERANANCMRAIEFQKDLVREAVRESQDLCDRTVSGRGCHCRLAGW
jgi:hypothetical protein